MDRVRQFILSIIGFAAFGFVFYLVFKDYKRLMLWTLVGIGGLVMLFIIVDQIGRIKDKRAEKKRNEPFRP
jgi:nucleoside recognition membrane protein YjiH